MSVSEDSGGDGRLPLRWSVIVAVAAGVGIGVGVVGGPVVGVGAGMAAAGLLARIVGR